jgi:hypothetical protein
MIRPTTVERAYQLAQSGECASITEVKQRLKAEGYEHVTEHLSVLTVAKAIRDFCRSARKDPPL